MQPKRKGKRTTKDNNELESKDCHVFTRRKLNPKPTMISDRTLRSSKTPVKTGTTSLSRCSEPHISRGHSSAPEEIQAFDVLAHQAINMAYQVPVEVSGQIQPPRYLVSDPVSHPPTLEQGLGPKEAINVENSTVDVPERMEEEDKTENSLSNHLRTGYSPQALSLKLTEQELGQKEARNVENSTVDVPEMMEEENKDESSLSNHSRTGWSPPVPAYSQKLTELAAMAAEDSDDDEVDSEVQSRTEDSVNGYKVKTEHMPILRKIIDKHGDIAKNCTLKLVRFRSALLGMICEIISDLENNNFTKIKQKNLEMNLSEVDGMKEMKVEVQWLHSRLIDILEAKRAFKQTGKLKEKIDIQRKSVDIAESAVEDCKAEIKNLEDQIKKFEDQKALWKVKLAKSRDEFSRTYNETISATAKINRFRNSSLVDDLL